jgi:hypothetical protein
MLPCLTAQLCSLLPPEKYDEDFNGQALETIYFDTTNFNLRKARLKKDQYCTVRIRCYPGDVYALSAKTESEKFRQEIQSDLAHMFIEIC